MGLGFINDAYYILKPSYFDEDSKLLNTNANVYICNMLLEVALICINGIWFSINISYNHVIIGFQKKQSHDN